MDVAVLYARPDSIYKSLSSCDVYDIERDARTYPGGMPVVAHPPCRAWGRLRQFAKPRCDEKKLALHAVEQIRKWGGVLEHPAYSTLWAAASLPRPGRGVDEYGGFSISIDQFWFGHKARKATWLYICGLDASRLPTIPLVFGHPTHLVTSNKRIRQAVKLRPVEHRKELSKRLREATPALMAEWLVEVARRARLQPVAVQSAA